ncbi:MAG: hypothetical protein CMJ78_17730 [Planctomycetaceae bacterium]|nr:hypothetical protein [Planctomycetaceae bacterium]
MNQPETIDQSTSTSNDEPGVSGRVVIIGIFTMAITMTAGLWFYWNMHTAPFRPLQIAIAEVYPKSEPRVQGGQRKIHKETPKILRIVMRVDFNPLEESNSAEIVERCEKLFELSQQHQTLSEYNMLELHYFRMKPEDLADQITLTLAIEDLLAEPSQRSETIDTAIQSAQRKAK